MKKMMICLTALIMLMGCTSLAENKAATEYTAKANAAWYDMLDFSDEAEKENALRGLIEALNLLRRDGILLVYPGKTMANADCTLSCARLQLLALMNGNADAIAGLQTDGDDTVPLRMVKYMTPVNRSFNIIEP